MTIEQQIQELEGVLNAHRQGWVSWSNEQLKIMTTILAQLKREQIVNLLRSEKNVKS